jgi:hypothetical protein
MYATFRWERDERLAVWLDLDYALEPYQAAAVAGRPERSQPAEGGGLAELEATVTRVDVRSELGRIICHMEGRSLPGAMAERLALDFRRALARDPDLADAVEARCVTAADRYNEF